MRVCIVAAELTKWGLIVSPTSRSAFGADLLVTDQKCKHAWSVQVKTNFDRRTFWLLSKPAREIKSDTHVYVFVNLGRRILIRLSRRLIFMLCQAPLSHAAWSRHHREGHFHRL